MRSPKPPGSAEYLLFRHFGSKAGLFREALVLPFTSFVDEFGKTWQAVVPEETDEEELSRQFVGQLYDVLVEHQGLLLTLVAVGRRSATRRSRRPASPTSGGRSRCSARSAPRAWPARHAVGQPDLPAHSTVAMIVGMVALRSTFFGTTPPSARAIVDELVQAILHGFLHRPD